MVRQMMLVLSLFLVFGAVAAETNVVDGQVVVCEDGVCRMLGPAEETVAVADDGRDRSQALPLPTRTIAGYRDETEFLAFLSGATPAPNPFADRAVWLVALLALLGGLALNLTPCVLPMVPVNLLIIGRSPGRGAAFGLGMALSYGALGVAAAIFGVGFGTIQSSPWFSAAVAVVFAVLALSLCGVFNIDFSRRRHPFSGRKGLFAAFALGALGAVLAGACVAPALIAVLVLTADLFASGSRSAIALPFVFGLGMALPWPFLGAGMSVLPKPGRWMPFVNRIFALLLLAFTARYAHLAWKGFVRADGSPDGTTVTPETFPAALASARRPVLVECGASWCKNCAAMERRIARSVKIREALGGFTVIRLRAEDLSAMKLLPGYGTAPGLPYFAVYE